MALDFDRHRAPALHPLHAVLLAGALPLFLGALLSDYAYAASYQIQWTNFASWLIIGGMIFSGFALLWALIDLIRTREGWHLLYFVVLLAAWVLGFINALVHAKDVWAAMPDGLILSAIVALLTIVAVWIGFSTLRAGGAK
ncbi:DUF2231 domain-containing protein [Sphingosinithalassobacter sp. CS137]|uniref:DUF2231 domain-containing protein n=1 Tax=Sphingosinithalassobacter sp. CS137 TaxID=2762748 RepID=UPI00165DF92D|nr:DUF2231 domain-containing protein [Sphingosinithalassobacter sp. CS137]